MGTGLGEVFRGLLDGEGVRRYFDADAVRGALDRDAGAAADPSLWPILNFALALRNGMQLVGYAAVGTGIIFFAMGALAATIKRDLGGMGKFLFVGMIALLIAMFANIFLQIPALALTISTLVIVVFSLFLLYDLNRIVRGGETNYVMATTGVYLSLLNIFSSLLQILLALSGDRD